MEAIHEDLSAAALAAANRDNLFEGMISLGRSPCADYRPGPPLTWMLSGVPGSFLNQVYVEPAPGDVGDQVIADALAYFRSRHVSATSWWARPGVDEAALGRRLEAQGLVFDDSQPGMAADLLALDEVSPPPGLTIERVRDQEALRCWADVTEAGFEAPGGFAQRMYELYLGLSYDAPLRSYLGSLDGQPVATSGLALAAGVACVICVTTVPEVRRRGIGTSMTLAAMQDARTLGYRYAVLQSSPMGYRVYEQLGFREVCRMAHWEWRDGLR